MQHEPRPCGCQWGTEVEATHSHLSCQGIPSAWNFSLRFPLTSNKLSDFDYI